MNTLATTPHAPTKAGFTLVETMMSLFAFAVIMMGAIGVATFSNNTAYSNTYKTVANQAAQGFIEQIRGTKFGLQLACITPNADGSPNHIELKYYDPVRQETFGNFVPVLAVAPGSPPPDETSVLAAASPIEGVHLNTVVVDGVTTAAVKLNMRMSVIARRDTTFDGIAYDLVYLYDMPSSGGGFRTVREVQSAYVANTAN